MTARRFLPAISGFDWEGSCHQEFGLEIRRPVRAPTKGLATVEVGGVIDIPACDFVL
jgi:hypothetical protein